MSHWKEIIVDSKEVTLYPPNPNQAKTVAASAVSSQVAAIVDDIVAVSHPHQVSKDLGNLSVTKGRTRYSDKKGVFTNVSTDEIDAAKVEALVTAIEAAPEKE